MNDLPIMVKLSIITINLNNCSGLERTIESVINQTSADFEFIIIDGASTDGSRELINKYPSAISNWISEPDNGIYDAMNKGINLSRGEYLLMLNSGDVLHENDTIKKVIDLGLDRDLIYGNILWIGKEKQFITTFPEKLTYNFFLISSLGHQGTFIRRELHLLTGLYDSTYKIVADWCFLFSALFRHSCTHKHINLTVADCKRDGISCEPSMWPVILKERELFISSKFPEYLKEYRILNKSLSESDVSFSGQIKRIVHKFILFIRGGIYNLIKFF
jgi:glycosyltransferase involved in cell wall biosynthesis